MVPSIGKTFKTGAFTVVELLVGTALVVLLAVASTSLLTVITRRVNNDRTRYTLATENARAAHIVSELARRSTRVWVYASLPAALGGSAPVPLGDVMAFTLADGTQRYLSFEEDAIKLYADASSGQSLTLAGGTPGMIVARIGTDAHCEFTQGLPRVGWLAEAQTTRGFTEQITYSAFAVSPHNR